jgi:imidazolonepropionase
MATPVPRDGPLCGPDLSAISLVPDAALLIRDGAIALAGPEDHVLRQAEDAEDLELLEAGGRVAVPGLVDPHTHLVFEGLRTAEFEQRIQGRDYLEILSSGGGILSTVEKTRQASPERLYQNALGYARRMAAAGTTTVEVKSGYGLDVAGEVKILEVVRRLSRELPMWFVPTFMGAHAVPKEFAGETERYVEYVLAEMLLVVAQRRLAEFCDVFCEKGVFSPDQSRRILARASALGLRPKLHADELSSTGGAELAAELGAVSCDHLVAVSERGMELLGRTRTVAVLLPGTSLFLGKARPAPAREMIARGVPVSLATDFNPGTSPVLSMQLVMSLACAYLRMTPAEALSAATLNAAYAVSRGGQVGALAPGRRADILIANAEDYREIAYFVGQNLAWASLKEGVVIAKESTPMF